MGKGGRARQMCVRQWQGGLDSVMQHTAVTPAQCQQLIFVQNGMLLPWLSQHGLECNTQVLLYISGTYC